MILQRQMIEGVASTITGIGTENIFSVFNPRVEVPLKSEAMNKKSIAAPHSCQLA
jgi:hypothetical protein